MHFPSAKEIGKFVEPFLLNAIEDSVPVFEEYPPPAYRDGRKTFIIEGLSITPRTEESTAIMIDAIKEEYYQIDSSSSIRYIKNCMRNENNRIDFIRRVKVWLVDGLQCVISDRMLDFEDRVWKYLWMSRVAMREFGRFEKYKISPFCHGKWRYNLEQYGMLKTFLDFTKKKSELEHITDSKFFRNQQARDLSLAWHYSQHKEENKFPFRYKPF